ncbi:MAG TPA: DUF6259 domain-containing protein, partial [Armatimonadota bacterium]|nr:DUF6259 domain-containing protein [Armatimonadota bacterium]
IPDWMKQGAPFVRFSRGWLSRPEQIERWLTDYWKRQFPEDLPLTIAYWVWEKVASWVTPDYFPLYPSDDEFIALAAMNREIGGHVFPWPSGYHYTMTFEEQADGSFTWDDRERFNRVARDHAVHKRNGDLYVRKASWLQGGANACMCPGDPFTIDWMNDIADELAECGADMIQVDQVVGGAFPACYKTDHPHPPGPGAWQAEVFRTQLKTMLARLREIEPDAVVSFEEPNEHFIQYAAIQDYRDIEGRWGDPRPDELASVFNYIYHEYLPTFQSNPRRGNGFLTAYCLVNGQTPHFVPTQDIGAGPLLAGGDFEEWADDQPRGWEKVGGYQGAVWNGKCARDETVKHSGDSSMRLENGADESVQVSRNVIIGDSFRRGRTYRVSAWIRTEDLAQVNGVNFGTLTHQLKSTGAGARIDMPAGTDDWARGDITLTIPEGTDFLRIMCHVDGPGKVWVDDVLLEEAGADGAFAEVRRPETPPDHDIMSRWVDLYSDEARPYLLFGRTLHPPKLECDSMEHGGSTYPAVLHNAYRAPDGSEVAILANATNEAQSATLQWHGDTVHLSLDPWEARLVR